LAEACREYHVQLFATTHSLEALDAMLATVPDDSDKIVSYRLPNPLTGKNSNALVAIYSTAYVMNEDST
jgi:AAA15 family ATPase/GTPase